MTIADFIISEPDLRIIFLALQRVNNVTLNRTELELILDGDIFVGEGYGYGGEGYDNTYYSGYYSGYGSEPGSVHEQPPIEGYGDA
jgi:hypothetical protein